MARKFTKGEIAAQVRQAVIDICGYPQDRVKAESDLEGDFGFDALELCELAMDLEDKFEIFIPEAEAIAMHTVGDWTGLVEGRLEAAGRVAEAKGNAAP